MEILEKVRAFGATDENAPLSGLKINRRELRKHDVKIDILFCGVCHSDLHQARGEWHNTIYPCVPGHEIVGRIKEVGEHVTKFKIGDIAAIGCIVDSCRECESCREGLEQYCENGMTGTYNSKDIHIGGVTYGGYSESIVADENYVLHVPENLELAAVAPLLCAGITTYSPLRHWNVGPGKKVGIAGIGGLGHMGVKLAKAMGAHVVVLTTSPSKVEDARRLGADEVVISGDPAQMKEHADSLDFLLDCISASHDINTYLSLVRRDGAVALVGAPENPIPVAAFSLIPGRKSFAGSAIGGIAETQEMLDFCGQHNIVSDIELINIDYINQAYERLLKGDVKYRFVIDMASIRDQIK